jgi:hypothetical protein
VSGGSLSLSLSLSVGQNPSTRSQIRSAQELGSWGMDNPLSEDIPLRSSTSVSSRKAISRGHPPYSSSDCISSWGLDLLKFPQTLLWAVYWPTSSPYGSRLI